MGKRKLIAPMEDAGDKEEEVTIEEEQEAENLRRAPDPGSPSFDEVENP